jgi:HAD superfamily hydrolase (TIGR01549 family)
VPVEAVIFDLDGTLANFNLDYKTLRAEVRSYLLRTSVPASLLNVNESIFEMLKKAEIFLKNNGKPAEAFEEVRSQAFAIAEKYEMEAASTTSLQPGANETLKELKRMNLKMGLCTTSSEKAAKYILQRFKIEDFFQSVVPRNKVKYVKPNTEQFELALKALGARPKVTAIVGDSTVDMQSAKELKAIAVGLPTGLSTMEQLMNNGANYIITSLTDLPVLIKKINEVKQR